MLLFNVYLINFLKFSPRRARSTRRKIIANDKTLLKMIQVYLAWHALKLRDFRVLRGECVLFLMRLSSYNIFMMKRYQLNKFVRYMCFCLATCFGMSTAVAGTYQSHKSIYQAAQDFVRLHVISQQNQQAKIKIGTLDSRLKLKQCNKPLQAFLPNGSRDLGKTTIGVKCNGTKPWSLHVSVTISVFKNVLVASHQLQKGTVLTESDIKLKKIDLAKLHYGFFEELKQGTGKKLKRRILAGAVLTPAMLKNPQLIRRGQQITIMAQSGRMMVRMEGKALANGAVGERIKVMNIKSRKKLEGVITSSGEVKVDI